jgi:hypothetical protein
VLDLHGLHEVGAHAACHQPQRPRLAVEGAQQALGLPDGGRGVGARVVVDDLHLGRVAGNIALVEIVGHDDHRVHAPLADLLLVLRGSGLDLDVVALEEVHERGRVLRPGDSHLEDRSLLLEPGDELRHEDERERPRHDGRHEHHHRGAPVAQRVSHLLPIDDGERRPHAAIPSPER